MNGWDRAYTNRITGTVHLLDMPSNVLLESVLDGRLPRVFLPSFLHEATHSWCLATSVGAAAALLEMRAHRTVNSDQYTPSLLLHDMAVVKIAHVLLNPLLEGMALFMEFDAAPGESDVFATPGLWASSLFRPFGTEVPNEKNIERVKNWITHQIYSVLVDYRSSPSAILRKTSVLMQPLMSDPELYLSGYMTVKQLWLAASVRTPAFNDRDLFLTFLRVWILEDWVFLEHMADEALTLDLVIHFLLARIQERLSGIARQDLREEAELFDHEIGKGAPDPGRMLRAIRINPYDGQLGQERLTKLIHEIDEGSKSGGDRARNAVDLATLHHRQKIVRLATEDVEIEVNDYNRVLVHRTFLPDSVYMSARAPEGAQRGVTKGWLSVCYLPDVHQMLTIAVREEQTMICIAPPSLSEDELAGLQEIVRQVIVTESRRAEMTEYCSEVAKGIGNSEYARVISDVPELGRRIYANYALTAAPKDQAPYLEALLGRKGFYDLLDKDGDLLTALVRISLQPLLNADTRKFVEEDLREEGIDLCKEIVKLEAVKQEYGLPILVRAANGVLWCTV